MKINKIITLLMCISVVLCGCKAENKIYNAQIDSLLEGRQFLYMFGVSDCFNYNIDEEIEINGIKYYKVTDSMFLKWSDWENYAKSIYTEELADEYLKQYKLINYNNELYTDINIIQSDFSPYWKYEIIENEKNKAVIIQKIESQNDEFITYTDTITFVFDFDRSTWLISEINI